ncbi:dipeptidase [Alkalicoccus halolimnae]|uniref:Dipeptidase n=1 Tax=Alkalicoccus halolimnae TaxID=1667239 RepID=A0A5C7F930_9BACI|nr:dipeptidase [Alkalicoccus halolimnae]TXF87172.1 membrane dipeptidase [Alkalicoccus halolimnae]
MNIIDLHCDALLKLQENRERSFSDSPDLNVNAAKMKTGQVKVQFFAVFIEPRISSEDKFTAALDQIDLFYEKILAPHPHIKHIKNWKQIEELQPDEIGAVLTLEGAEAFHDDLGKLRTFYRLGVRSIGLTWNNANLCADGIGEKRGAGLSSFGEEVVKLNNSHHVLTDLSHLSVQAYWDVIDLAGYPIATHSNAKRICGHRRNLDDDQLRALFQKEGLLGIVYNPPFIKNEKGPSSIEDLLVHIEHMLLLGGENHIALGSDFDGIETFVEELSDASLHQNLIHELENRYGQETAFKISSGNAEQYFRTCSERIDK